MHRSGTSVLSRALMSFDVSLSSNLMPSHVEVNAKGFFEDLDIVALNEEALAALGSAWHHFTPINTSHLVILRQLGLVDKAKALLHSKFGATTNGLFSFKDPRTARLIPFWKEVFADESYEVSYLLSYRNPLSVATSLEKRDGFEILKNYWLWLLHVLPSLLETNGAPRVLVNYDQLLQTPELVLSRIANKLDLSLNEASVTEYVGEFLTPELRHTQFATEDLVQDPRCPSLAVSVHRLLDDISTVNRDLDSTETCEMILQLNEEMRRVAPLFELLDKKYQECASFALAADDKDQKINELNSIVESESQQRDRLSSEITDVMQQLLSKDNDLFELSQTVQVLKDDLSQLKQNNDEIANALQIANQSLQWTSSDLLHATQRADYLVDALAKEVSQQEFFHKQLDFANETIAQQGGVIKQLVASAGQHQVEFASLIKILKTKGVLSEVFDVFKKGLKKIVFWRAAYEANGIDLSNLPQDFDPVAYLKLNPDVAIADFEPQKHYLLHGRAENRRYKNG